MKKILIFMIIFSTIILSLSGCGDTYNNVYGDNNSVGNEKTVNGVNVDVPIDVDVNNEQNNIVDNNVESETTDSINNTSNDFSEFNSDENDDMIETVVPFVTASPQSDTVIHADLTNWTSEDRDIFNNNYTGSNTMKLSVYNMIYAMGGGSDDITAEIHMPFGERFDETWVINFVVMQDMLGNGSYANVTILSGEEEIYPAFIMKSDTTDKLEYEINLSGIRDLVIRFECHAVDGGFCGGVIFTNNEE